jgi:hypothetical protein
MGCVVRDGGHLALPPPPWHCSSPPADGDTTNRRCAGPSLPPLRRPLLLPGGRVTHQSVNNAISAMTRGIREVALYNLGSRYLQHLGLR